ncbi:MAG: hypothetical protein AAGI44_10575 [Pseudomonadota bacterium]
MKVFLITIAALSCLVAGLSLWVLYPVLTDPVPGFAVRQGTLISAEDTGFYELTDSTLTEMTLTSSSGMQVQLALRRPDQPLPGNPVMVLIAGQESGRAAAMMFPETHGVAVAALSYLYQGSDEFSRMGIAMDLHKIQQAILDTTPAVMLAIDYLYDQSGLNPQSVELVGVSFGAFLASVPAALDERISRLWLIHGAGDPARVIDRGLEGRVWPGALRAGISNFLARVGGWPHLTPERWVGEVAPRPVIVINGLDDDDMPELSVGALHAALGEPNEVLWVEGGHIHPKRPETITRVIDLMFPRLVPADSDT